MVADGRNCLPMRLPIGCRLGEDAAAMVKVGGSALIAVPTSSIMLHVFAVADATKFEFPLWVSDEVTDPCICEIAHRK